MSQRRLHSFGEAVFNNVVSFGIAYGINLIVIPVFRRTLTDNQTALWLTTIFSIVSIVRQYILRRFFNWLHLRQSK